MELLGHLLWVAKNVAEKENLNDSGYRLGKSIPLTNIVQGLTVSYRPSFSPTDLWPKRKACGP